MSKPSLINLRACIGKRTNVFAMSMTMRMPCLSQALLGGLSGNYHDAQQASAAMGY